MNNQAFYTLSILIQHGTRSNVRYINPQSQEIIIIIKLNSYEI